MPPNAVSEHRVLLDLQEDNGFFDFVVDMIPADLYVSPAQKRQQDGGEETVNKKYYRGQAVESKEARRARAKQAKRAKLDPQQTESTTQIQKRLNQDGRPPLVSAGDVAVPAAKTAVRPATASETPPSGTSDAPATTDNVSRIEALRAKLHAKIQAKRSQRPDNPNAVSKRAARRAEKKRRQEEAKNKKKKSAHTKADKGETARLFQVGKSSAVDASQDLAGMDFGRLAGLNANARDNYSKSNKSLANLNKTKNLQKMLADAEAKREKLERLKRGNEADKQKAASMQWGDTLKEASGERVKNDPAKIKKALKRKAVQKAKSVKAWKSRQEQTKEKMDERQKIRNHNLSKRKLGGQAGANLSKKRIALADFDTPGKKSGDERRLSRSGFEGKKLNFLNNNKNNSDGGKKQAKSTQ